MSETNYQRLFGTPERAARTVHDMIQRTPCVCKTCEGCPCLPFCFSDDDLGNFAWPFLEWLESEES